MAKFCDLFFSGAYYLNATKRCRGEVSDVLSIHGEGDTLRGVGRVPNPNRTNASVAASRRPKVSSAVRSLTLHKLAKDCGLCSGQ